MNHEGNSLGHRAAVHYPVHYRILALDTPFDAAAPLDLGGALLVARQVK